MTQRSKPWQFGLGDGLGAAADGSYTADEWDNIFDAAFGQGAPNYGVLRGFLNALRVYATTPASARVFVATGGAFVNGKYYENDALVTFPIAPDPAFPAPAALARYDRVVLRASWATRTVRLYRIAGAEGGGAGSPALVQIPGVTWDVPLALIYFTVAGGGVAQIITDERCHIEPRQREFDAIVGLRPGDYATLTAAVADGHKSIFVRAGTYTEPAGVTLISGMWLCGEDANASILDFGANQLVVNEAPAAYADHVLIENLQFKSANVGGAVVLQRSRYGTVRRCMFDTTRGLFMTADALEHVIADNWFNAITGGYAIYALGLSHILRGNRMNEAVIYIGNTAEGTTICESVIIATAVGNPAIYAAANYVRIENNTITSDNTGIWIAGTDNIIAGNTCTGCAASGILVAGDRATVDHNICNENDIYGISVTADHAAIQGNHCHDNTFDGIYVNGTHCGISGNVCTNNSREGIYILDEFALVNDNQCTLNADNGITFDTAAHHGVCKGNVCAGNLSNGITCDGDQVIMGDNNCYGNTQWGIDYTGDRCIVLGNIALTNGAGQIDATGATNQIQDHNIVA